MHKTGIGAVNLTWLSVNGVASISLILSWPVAAQNCPAGIPSAGNPLCIPQDRDNSPHYQQANVPAKSAPRWRLTWGAIALDETTGDIGVTTGSFSKIEAKREAMNRCEIYGSKDCEILFAYENQCAAIARPIEDGNQVAGKLSARGGPTLEITSAETLARCSTLNDGGDCKIIYSECTAPILVR